MALSPFIVVISRSQTTILAADKSAVTQAIEPYSYRFGTDSAMLVFSVLLPDNQNGSDSFERSPASPVCPFAKSNVNLKMNVDQ